MRRFFSTSGFLGKRLPSLLPTLHPDIHRALLQDVTAEVASSFESMSYQSKIWLDTLFGTDGLAGPAYSSVAAQYLQEARQRAIQGKAPTPPPQEAASDLGLESSTEHRVRAGVTNRGA